MFYSLLTMHLAPLLLLCSIVLTSGAVHQSKLIWRQSRRFDMIRTGEWATYKQYLERQRRMNPGELASLTQNVGQTRAPGASETLR